jgi:hypothetical protein
MMTNHPLPMPLRPRLENSVKAARDIAEAAARAGLVQLAMADAKAPDYLTESQRVLRSKLRSRVRALSATSYQNNSVVTCQLVKEVAYVHCRRMLFPCFLAESGLLMWEPGAAVSLDDCCEMVANGTDGALARLSDEPALKKKLNAIQLGEFDGKVGFDIFVRWKPLAEQAVGWNLDLTDGVRMNIRPFITVEILRHNKKPKLNITWDKDRGKDVESAPWFQVFISDRIYGHHLTLAEKREARARAGGN